MKTRNGFVSNSSSNSFVILGERTHISDVDVKDLKNKNYKYIAVTGLHSENGDMFVDVKTEKMLDLLKRADGGEFDAVKNRIEVYKAYFSAFDSNVETEIDTIKFPKKLGVFSGTADQYSPSNEKELEAMYKGEY